VRPASGRTFGRTVAYARRALRGLAILQRVGRSGLFRIENRVAIARLDYGPRDIYMRMDSRYAPARIRACAKEPWTVAWLERWVGEGDVLYDVGANAGAYSLVAASLHEGTVQVVAIEPAYATFSSLCDNIVLNDAGGAITPLNVVLASTTGLGHLNYRDLEAGAGLHSTGDRPFLDGRLDPAYRQRVLTYRLDDLLSRFPLPRPNHLKIDVDGGELDVLEGASETLASNDLRTVMIDVNEGDSDPITSLLAEYGLEMSESYDSPSVDGHWYALFVRSGADD
jgi:FkbM family methyltransferase